MKRQILYVCLMAVLSSGCAAPAVRSLTPSLPTKATAVKRTGLSLDAAKFKAVAFSSRYMEITGDPGAVTGEGVWVSLGTHEKPFEGWERLAKPDGSFMRVIDVKGTDTVTLWAYRDEGEKRFYSAPVVLTVQAAPAPDKARRPR